MMDAINFVKQLRRMKKEGVLKNYSIYPCPGQETDSPEEVVAEVEEWAKEHPVKTRQNVLLEQYPNANISDDGLPDVAPCQLCIGLIHGKSAKECEYRGLCKDCRRKFWLTEVE